jgi:hypothetical protein
VHRPLVGARLDVVPFATLQTTAHGVSEVSKERRGPGGGELYTTPRGVAACVYITPRLSRESIRRRRP